MKKYLIYTLSLLISLNAFADGIDSEVLQTDSETAQIDFDTYSDTLEPIEQVNDLKSIPNNTYPDKSLDMPANTIQEEELIDHMNNQATSPINQDEKILP